MQGKRGYLLITAANPNSPPIAAPAAAPGDIPEEELVGADGDPLFAEGVLIGSDSFLGTLLTTVGGVSETFSKADVEVCVFVDVEVFVDGDVSAADKGPSATIFLKAVAIQTLI